PAGLAEGEHRLVLDQPQLVHRVLAAGVGEGLHRLPHRRVGPAAEVADPQRTHRRGAYSVHFTSGCSRSAACALSYSSRELARKRRRTDTKRPPLDARLVTVSCSTARPAARRRLGTSTSSPAVAGPIAVISNSPGNWKPCSGLSDLISIRGLWGRVGAIPTPSGLATGRPGCAAATGGVWRWRSAIGTASHLARRTHMPRKPLVSALAACAMAISPLAFAQQATDVP